MLNYQRVMIVHSKVLIQSNPFPRNIRKNHALAKIYLYSKDHRMGFFFYELGMGLSKQYHVIICYHHRLFKMNWIKFTTDCWRAINSPVSIPLIVPFVPSHISSGLINGLSVIQWIFTYHWSFWMGYEKSHWALWNSMKHPIVCKRAMGLSYNCL